ncbi:MAG: 4-(cytidine 5-diphospho)-2-C-methyl-D-erythritol kinase [Phycisphaerales bacterium]|nr:4-(cytidine 5-diphospho)-2-C-methyl-D-erythritol kinase [Phycisphaerales bacterium]
MRVRCPAKINLDLHVGPLREDGFHPLRTWMVTVGLYDHLNFRPADRFSLTCDDPAIPTDSKNLVWRVANVLGREDVSIHIEKQIPAGGGLGGGSSDAAFTFLALNHFWQLDFDREFMCQASAELGSDVPFFFHLPSAICEGRGEVITPVRPPLCGWAVLLLPKIAMPTPAVFRRFDELVGGADFASRPQKPREARSSDAMSLLASLINDLEPAAFDLRPDLAELRQSAEALVGRPVRMSGSGSTLFTLFDNPMPAIAAATKCQDGLGIRCLPVPLAVYARGIPPDDPPGEGNEAPRD